MASFRKLSEFIEKYIDLIDAQAYDELYYAAYREMTENGISDLTSALEDIGVDTKHARLKVLADNIIGEMNSARVYAYDKANSWSRLQYILGATGYMDLTYEEILEYLISNQKDLGLNISPITDPRICWDHVPDHDLGFLDKTKFLELYSDSDW